MQSKATTVTQYLEELPSERRAAIARVRAVIRENLDPLFEEGMQYGMIGYYVPHRVYPPGYHCDPRQPLPFAGLASQKNHMAVYLGCVYGHPANDAWFRAAWARTGKQLDMGKSCIRFRKLDDLALDVIGEVIRRTEARAFIQHYEAAVGARPSQPTGRTPAESARPKGRRPAAASASATSGKSRTAGTRQGPAA